MKKATLVLVLIVAGLGLVGTAYGQRDMSRRIGIVKETGPFKFQGVVKSVDKEAKTIVVTTPQKGDLTLRCDTAKFEGAYTGVDNVKVGDQVLGAGNVVDGQYWVKEMSRKGGAEK